MLADGFPTLQPERSCENSSQTGPSCVQNPLMAPHLTQNSMDKTRHASATPFLNSSYCPPLSALCPHWPSCCSTTTPGMHLYTCYPSAWISFLKYAWLLPLLQVFALLDIFLIVSLFRYLNT